MNIGQFRQRYPQYNDLPDEEIVKRLHDKFHQTEDYNAFRSRFLARPSVESQKAVLAQTDPYWAGEGEVRRALPTPQRVAEPTTIVAPEATLAPETGAGVPKMGTSVPKMGTDPNDPRLASLKPGERQALLNTNAPEWNPDLTKERGYWGNLGDTLRARTESKVVGGKLAVNEEISRVNRLNAARASVLPAAVAEAKRRGINILDVPTVKEAAAALKMRPDMFIRGVEDYAFETPENLQKIIEESTRAADEADAAAAPLLERGKKLGQIQQKRRPKFDSRWDPRSIAFDAMSSLPDLAAAAAVSVTTGSPAAGVASIFATTAPDYYAQARAEGKDPSTAQTYSLLMALGEAAPESRVLSRLTTAEVRKLIGDSAFKTGAKEAGATALAEGVSEMVTEVYQQGLEIGLYDKKTTLKEVLQDIAYAGAVGSVMGAPLGAVAGASAKAETPEGPAAEPDDLADRANEAYIKTFADTMAELSGQKMPQSARKEEAARRAIEAALEVVAERSPVDAARLRLNKLEQDAAAGKTVDPARLQEAREAVEQATVESVRGKLREGKLTPEQQQEAAQALRDMDSTPEEGAGEVRGVVRPEKPAKGQPPAEPAPKGVPTAKPDAPLSEVETARQDALNRVANADTIEEGALNDLIAEGLAKINPQTQRPVLLPPGKRQRSALNKRAEAAEAAELAEKEAAKPEPVAKKPQPKSPKKTQVVAKPQQPVAEAKPPKTPPDEPPGPPPTGVKVLKEAPSKPADAVATPQEEEFVDDRDGPEGDFVPAQPIEAEAMEEPGPGPAFAVREGPLRIEGMDGKQINVKKVAPESIKGHVALHGTDALFSQFDPAERGGVSEASDAQEAFWLTDSESRARKAAQDARDVSENTVSYVRGVRLNPKNPIEIDQIPVDPAENARLLRRLKRAGHDLVVYRRGEEGEPDYALLDPAAAEILPGEDYPRDIARAEEDMATARAEGRNKGSDARGLTRRKKPIVVRGNRKDKPAFAVAGDPETPRAVPMTPEEVNRAKDAKEAWRRQNGYPAGFEQDNPAVRGDENGREWLREEQEKAEGNILWGRKHNSTNHAPAKGLTGSVTAWVRGLELPVAEVRKLKGAAGEENIRKPGEAQYDSIMRSVGQFGWKQEWPIMIAVNHKGEAYIYEGNTRTAVASTIGQETIKAEIRWYNGGEMVDGPFSPQNVKRMTEPQPAFAVAQAEEVPDPAPTPTRETLEAAGFDVIRDSTQAPTEWVLIQNGDGQNIPRWGLRSGDAVRAAYQTEAAAWARAEEIWQDAQPRFAPNGKPSKLSYAQWRQVRTPEFKAWFGDWEKYALMPGGVRNDDKGEVSKVVDPETGEPMVVYHGTTRGGFRVFNKDNAIGHTTSAPAGTAFFTNDRAMAATYSNTRSEVEISDELPDGFYVYQDTDETWFVSNYEVSDDSLPSAISWGFATREEAISEARKIASGDGQSSGLYSVFLNIRRPNEHNFEGANWDGSRDHQWVVVPVGTDDESESGLIEAPDGTIYFEERDEAERLSARTPGTTVANAGYYFMHDSTNQVVHWDKALPSIDGSIIRDVIDEGQFFGGSGANDVFVAFDPTQIKSATQNRGTFDPKNPDITFATNDEEVRAKVFYSALTLAGENAKMTKGSAAQWYGALKNTPGVKQEELDWSGVKEWLGDRKGVTKEEVVAYLRANQLLITEQELVAPKLEINRDSQYYKVLARNNDFMVDLESGEISTPFQANLSLSNDGDAYRAITQAFPELVENEDWERVVLEDLLRLDGQPLDRDAFRAYDSKSTKASKYAQYQLPGGQNYHMILLQLPDPTPRAAKTPGTRVEKSVGANTVSGEQYYVYDAAGELLGFGDTAEEARMVAANAYPDRAPADTFRSPHFPDDRNVVAHVRLNERYDLAGNLFLFAETIQSDWHQEGRKSGYRGTLPAEGLPPGIEISSGEPIDHGDRNLWTVSRADGSIAQHGIPSKAEAIEFARLTFQKDSVPDAPFKTTWPELVMKRLIRYAAENGYDGIGWTTGAQQADRWGEDTEEGMVGFYDEILPHAAGKVGKKYGAKTKKTPFVHSDLGIGISNFSAHGMLLTPELKTAALGGFPMFAVNRAGQGLPAGIIERAVRPAERLLGVPITVLPDPKSAPKHIAAAAAAVDRRVAGVYDDRTKRVYLFANGIDTIQQAVEFYAHEVVGHKGLRALLGPNYHAVMQKIIADFKPEVLKAQKKNAIGEQNGVLAPFDKLSVADQNLSAEETVAYAAQALLGKRGVAAERSRWHKMVTYVVSQLRKIGMFKKWREHDLHELIYRARDHVRREASRGVQRAYEAKVEKARDKAITIPKPDPVNDGPLLGMPTVQTIPGVGQVKAGPFAPARRAAAEYKRRAGIRTPEVRTYAKVNEENAKRIARAYQNMKHDPLDPRVKAAYDAMVRETLAQYQVIKAAGLKVEFISDGQDPYAASPRLAIEDVRNNNHLWVFPTDSGFGMDADAEYMKNNPLLQPTNEFIGRRQLLANDVFRIVHDYFGHIQEGNGFRADGEENAWRIHASMYSPLARAAMTSETRGQNSWLNFGPHGKKNRKAKNAETVYAEQKIGLLPPEFWNPEPETAALAVRSERVTPLPSRELALRARRIFQRTIDTPESGFSLDVYGNAPPNEGYTVSTDKGTERPFTMIPTADEMAAYIDQYRDRLEAGGQFFGGWRAGPAGTNRYVLDVSQWFADHDEAREAAKAAQQEALFDLAKMETEYLTAPTFAVADEVADTIRDIAKHLTPQERTRLNRSTARKLVDLFETLPDEKERGAVALAGAAARGWYRDSAETIADIFGPDAPRFAGLLAALSPQVSVQNNLKNAVALWAAWDKAGRPVKKSEIIKLMKGSLWGAQDRKGERVGVLPSWINNTVRALSVDDALNLVLSGPKVSSFAVNLRNEVNEVTLDSWMAAFDKLDAKKMFGGRLNVKGDDPGKTVGYKAVAARIRQTAAYLTKMTGETWTPAEVQETIWAWTKTLTELAAKYGPLSSAEEIVKDGELTNELINATVNFATLFTLPEQQELLRNLGYGERIDRAVERAQARRSARGQAPALSGADQKRLLTAARRIDSMREDRPRAGVMGASRLDDIPFAVNEEQEAAFSVLGGNTGNADLDAFLGKIGDRKRSLGQMWQDWTENLSARAQMAVFDDLYGIKRAGDIAGISAADVGFKNAHLAKSAAELTQAMIEYGYPVWLKDGTHMVAGVEGGQGLVDILKPLGEKVNLWAAWMVARRADRLMGEGRENLFEQNEIAAALALGQQHPEFQEVADAYAAFQKKVLDFAQEAGSIDPDSRALWENADYIPFYRIIESGQIQGPNGGGVLGKVRNQIRKLKGGTANIGDPLENIARNWYSLMDASLKAHAARTVVDALDGSGLVTRAPQVEITSAIVPLNQIEKFIKNNPLLVQHLKAAGVDPAKLPPAAFAGLQKMLAVQPPSGEDIISVWRNGKREYWHVHDALLFESLMNVNKAAWGPLMEFFRFPKRFGTAMITTTAAFGVKNFFRDMLHTFVQGSTDGQTTIIPGLDSVKGAISQFRMDEASQALLAGGGSFTHGYIRAGDTAGAAATIRRALRKADPSSAVLDTPAKVFRFYRDLLNASENAHRVAIYSKMLAKGASRLDALYEARDLLDFAKRGNNVAIRFLTESVMFLNARMQGLYRLGRGASAGRAALSIAMRGSLYMLGMLALLAFQHDDERYKALTDADKASYIHFFDVFREGDHYRLPVPFEVGTIFGTFPVAIMEALISDEPDAGRQALAMFGHAITQSLDLSPDIQVAMPILELAINKDTFTKAPILTMGDEAVLPEEQDDPRLSPTLRGLARALPEIAPEALRSPKQLNHLVRGYTGPVLDYGLFATDAIVRRAMGEPAPATKTLRDYPDIKAFVQTGPQRMTRYQNDMFDIADRAERVAASIRRLENIGTDEAEARIEHLEAENFGLLNARDDFREAAQEVIDLRKTMREIQLDRDMTPEEKREELDALQNEINDIARDVWGMRPGGPLNPDIAVELIDKDVQGRIDVLNNNKLSATARALQELE